MYFINNNTNIQDLINLDTLSQLTPIESIDKQFKLPLWSILLIVFIVLLTSSIILCSIFCWIRTKCKKLANFFKPKYDAESMITIKPKQALLPLPSTLFKEQIQPEVEQLASSMPGGSAAAAEEEEEKENNINYGTLDYVLDYDFQKVELNFKIIQANNLAAKDANGLSDPYVKVYLLPDKKKKFQTSVLKKTLNPVYNETFTFKNIPYGDLRLKTILLRVYDYDRFSRHDQIGELRIPLANVDLGDTVKECKDLVPPSGRKNDDNHLGSVCFSLRYAPTASKITVTVFEAKNLKKMDLGRLSDPYVKIGLYKNGRRIEKKKTSIKFYTLNPYYNESFTFDRIDEKDLKNGNIFLIVTVVDYDRIGSSEPIGRVILGPNAYDSALRHWNEMLAAPRRPIAYWHILRDVEDD